MLIKQETLWSLIAATGQHIEESIKDDLILAAYQKESKKQNIDIEPVGNLVDVEIMTSFFNIPFQIHIDSIQKHYIHMSATKQWICINYPSAVLRSGKENITIPEPMQSILSIKDKEFIWSEWERLFPNKFKSKA